jgi:hypothetical protein
MSTSAGPNIVEDGLVLSLDPANQKSYSPNVFQFSTDIFSWTTAASRAVLSRDTIASPVGNKPLKMVPSGNDPFTNSYNSAAWNVTPVVNGETWTLSVYVKANRATRVELFLFGANSSGVGFVDGSWIGLTAKGFDIGTEWTRISHSITYNNANVAFLHFRLDGTPTLDSGVEIWWDGVQVEKNSTETAFNPNYYGTTINDISNNSNNGTLTNSPIFFAEEKGGLLYNGTNTNITIPHNSSKMDFSLGQTVCMVLKPTTGSESARRNPYNQAYGGPGTMTHEPNRTINYYFGTNGGNNNPYVGRNSVFTVNTNELAFIAVSRNQSLNTCKWYKNGALISTQDAGGYTTTANGSSPILIGQGYTSNFLGNIYATYVYNRGLTDEEIKQNFNALRGRYGI